MSVLKLFLSLMQECLSTRNKALSQCQGEYICFVDSDDLIEPNFLITLLQLISHQADLAICGFTRSMVFCMDDAQRDI